MRPPPLAIRASARFEQRVKDLWLSATGAVLTAGDGLAEKMRWQKFCSGATLEFSAAPVAGDTPEGGFSGFRDILVSVVICYPPSHSSPRGPKIRAK
jgi:hypothetical protein